MHLPLKVKQSENYVYSFYVLKVGCLMSKSCVPLDKNIWSFLALLLIFEETACSYFCL